MKILKNYILPLLCLLMMGACTQENTEKTGQNDTSHVSIHVSTRASSEPHDAVSDIELIQNYRVIIADTEGTVLRCIDGVCNPATELDPIETTLNVGTYYVYGFANINKQYLDNLGLHEGGSVPDNISSIRFFMPEPFSNTTLLPAEQMTEGIPMTSERQTITVTGANQTFGIEVRRLFAKLEFVFSNPTDNDLQVSSQSISNMTINGNAQAGSILLMSYDDNTLNLPSPTPTSTLTHTYTSPLVVNSGVSGISRAFYVLESNASAITNAFDLAFSVTRKDEIPSGTEADYMRYALTDPETLTTIRRNDWIVIPITFGEWQMHLEARSYPPIGGYPEAQVEETEGNEFVVTFKGGGDFSIRPSVRKYYDGSNWFGIDDKTKVSGAPVVTVSDPQHLFDQTPSYSTRSGEILGRMTSAPGRSAEINISVNVIVSTSPLVTKTLTRKIFISQQ